MFVINRLWRLYRLWTFNPIGNCFFVKSIWCGYISSTSFILFIFVKFDCLKKHYQKNALMLVIDIELVPRQINIARTVC